MGFLVRFFTITVTVVILFGRGAHAQCCWCDEPDGCPEGFELISENYGCEQCGGFVYGVDCSYCDPEPPNPCEGYDLTCPSDDGSQAWSTIKCKVVSSNCNGVSGCTKYEACNSVTGNKWPDLSGNCHFENGTCYGNTRPCWNFNNDTENTDMDCSRSYQQGQAEWKANRQAWDTKNCYCNIEHVSIGNEFFGVPWWCDNLNANYVVSEANRYVTTSVSMNIIYTLERMYCAKCHPGYLPTISQSPGTSGVYSRPDNNGTWGVAMCSDQVTMHYYTDGCEINFNLSSGAEAVAACRKLCPSGLTINVDGATSMSQCVSTGEIYEDDTGTFVIGSDVCP